MPYRAKKPCAHRGCAALTTNRYCDTHAKEYMKHYNKFERDPNANKRYGSRWRKIRAAFLLANPLCELCRDNGRFVPAEMVHHKRKLSEGGTHEKGNLRALCQECHSRLHAQDGDYF